MRHREAEPAAVMCTLTVDDHTVGDAASKRYMLGREPILTPRRRAARRREGPPLVRHERRRRARRSASTC